MEADAEARRGGATRRREDLRHDEIWSNKIKLDMEFDALPVLLLQDVEVEAPELVLV